MNFVERLQARIEENQSHLVVGLDPHWSLLPKDIREQTDPDQQAHLLEAFLTGIVEATWSHCAAFKPQIAFFEQLGAIGFRVLDALIQRMRRMDAIIIMDAKRNDIGSTADAYAQTFFGKPNQPACLQSDALTVNGYLGWDGIRPFVQFDIHGLFVLVKTSNPSSGDFQDLELADGRLLCEAVADQVNTWNEATRIGSGYGRIGAVVGATYPEHMTRLRKRMPHSFLLVPGYGAQGGDLAAIRAAFNADGTGALINASRSICFPTDWERKGFKAVAESARLAQQEIQSLRR